MHTKILVFISSVGVIKDMQRLLEIEMAQRKLSKNPVSILLVSTEQCVIEEIESTTEETQIIAFIGSSPLLSSTANIDFVRKIKEMRPDALLSWYSYVEQPATADIEFYISKQTPLSVDETKRLTDLHKNEPYSTISWEVMSQMPFIDLLFLMSTLHTEMDIRQAISKYAHQTATFLREKI